MAREDPERWATNYATCDVCHHTYCDRCVENAAGKCPGCGKRLELQKPVDGPAAELPAHYREVLRKIDEKAAASKGRRTEAAGPARKSPAHAAATPKKLLTIYALVALLALALSAGAWALPAASAGSAAAWWALKLVGVLAVGFIVAPIAGNACVNLIGRIIEGAGGARATFTFLRTMVLAQFALLLASPLFIYHAHYAWGWPGWRVAFAYAGIAGFLVGGVTLAARVFNSMKKAA
jgi:hypothetical protein